MIPLVTDNNPCPGFARLVRDDRLHPPSNRFWIADLSKIVRVGDSDVPFELRSADDMGKALFFLYDIDTTGLSEPGLVFYGAEQQHLTIEKPTERNGQEG